MAAVDIQRLVRLAPELLELPFQQMWSSYDREADVLYLTFKKPSHADDSVLTDDDVIVRYEGTEIVGITILHASRRAWQPVSPAPQAGMALIPGWPPLKIRLTQPAGKGTGWAVHSAH